MALRQATTARGLPIPEGYWRATMLAVRDKTKGRAHISLFKDEATARNEEERPYVLDMRVVNFEYDPEGANLHTQAYDAAKLRPQFEGATDVFEAGQRDD